MRELRALRVLEFQSIRDRLAAHCQTELGQEKAVELSPSFDESEVWELLDTTREAYERLGHGSPPNLSPVKDVRGALKRASKGGHLGGKELYEIGIALQVVRFLKEYIEADKSSIKLNEHSVGLIPQQKVEDALLYSLEPDGELKDSASPELMSLRTRKKGAQAKILERIQAYTSGKQRELLSDPIYTVREGRYVIPLKAENRGKIRGILHDTSATGQTLFIEPDDVVNAANALREIESAEREEELKILRDLTKRLVNIADVILGSLLIVAELDFIFGKARLGYELKGCFPDRVKGNFIQVEGGRHPLLDPAKVVPISLKVGRGASVLITGPNTGGKTVAIKTVGLFVAMAQSGLMLPAYHVRLGAFTQIWADIGDEQSIEQSLSTFSGHIKNIASALNLLESGGLVLLDEIGAGTDPAEGAALARSILEALSARGAIILASTHYGELKAFAFTDENFTNASMEFDAKTLRPTYRVVMGAAGASQALKIAEKYGISKELVERAKENLSEQERDVAEMLANLENAQKQARAAQSEADRKIAELKKLEEEANRKLREADDIRKRANSRAHDAIESTLREIRIQADDLITQLKKSGGSNDIQRVRRDLEALDTIGKELAANFKPKDSKINAPSTETFSVGDAVTIQGYTHAGTILQLLDNNQAVVQSGPLKLTVPTYKLAKATKVNKGTGSSARQLVRAKVASMGTEIHLRNKRAEPALEELEKFIDDAILGAAPWVRIVHGKGDGILRQITQEFLKKHPEVKRFRDGEPAEGGQGVTIAEFR